MITFGFPVDVKRSVDEVFAYVTDPANLPEWQQTEKVEQLSAGTVAKGTRFREVRTVLGRRLETISEVTDYQRDQRFDLCIISTPARVADRWRFEAVDGGTRLHFSTEGHARASLRLLEPMIAAVLERRRRGHHERLKLALERG